MTLPLFAIIAIDVPGSEMKRAEHREGHLAHFKAHADKIAVAGPLTGVSSGSLVIYRAESEAAAHDFIMADPFASAGVWDKIHVFNFKAGSGSWAG